MNPKARGWDWRISEYLEQALAEATRKDPEIADDLEKRFLKIFDEIKFWADKARAREKRYLRRSLDQLGSAS